MQQNQAMSSSLNQNISSSFAREDARLAGMQDLIDDRLRAMDKRISDSSLHSEVKLESMRDSMEKRLQAIRDDSSRQLDEIRNTVDEKLQKTLEDKIGQSFRLVSERLEQVYRSLGEVQSLSEGVGDLKKVLSNVKTRGIFGELQLGAILSEILSTEQYDTNVVTRPGSGDPVEYAVKFPGEGGETVYLPIDSKFPMDAYQQLMDAYDSGDKAAIDAAGSYLETRIKQEGRKIRDKYISPPHTTDFAVMFFPVEGLYAEAVRRGLVDILQQSY
ncbi:MAG: DNA recombination protein RmuC, partial [Oscillospiraceae bacterium]|nr:DNA recombination protein RmuC [Oscillospiraceae bacterium]